jgi:hypothetical protein
VPGKESGGGAHPSRDASVERWGGAAQWRSAAVELARWSPTTQRKSCTTGGERERRVRWGSRRARRGAASGSPVKADDGGVSGEIRERSEALASEADRLIPGRTGEVAACVSVGEKERSGKESGTMVGAF